MSNKLRKTLFPTEQEIAQFRYKYAQEIKKLVEEKSCSVCVHFYDYSTGVSTNYGCDLGGNYNDIAISRINRGQCGRWEKDSF